MEELMDWFIQFNDFWTLWRMQPTYMLSQCLFLYAGIATLIHAFIKGGKWPWLWLAIVIHGLITDNFWHFVLPEMDNFWHSPTPVILLGGRTPLHIILLYPAFIYTAAYAVSRARLPELVEPFAVGLVTLLIDLPYDIISVKFVHWTWHDTDPNVFDRHYHVPWTSYYFHATFAASLVFIFNMSYKGQRDRSSGVKACWFSSFFAMPGGILLFMPIYHPLHDIYEVHTEVICFFLFAIYGAIVLTGLIKYRTSSDNLTKSDYLLIVQIVIHYALFLLFAVYGKPENEVSRGLHQPLGPCHVKEYLTTPLGMELEKNKYLCAENYDEGYFDFHCAPHQKLDVVTEVYTICGTSFQNREEYITVMAALMIIGYGVFYGLFYRTQNYSKMRPKKLN